MIDYRHWKHGVINQAPITKQHDTCSPKQGASYRSGTKADATMFETTSKNTTRQFLVITLFHRATVHFKIYNDFALAWSSDAQLLAN